MYPSLTSKLDLRAPAFTRLRKHIGIEWLGAIALVMIDSSLLTFAWQIAETYGTPLHSYWDTLHNPLSLLPILTTEIGLIAVQGLYQSGEKRRNYLSLIKAIAFAHLLLLLISFFYEPNRFVSRSTFILSLILSLVTTCSGRVCVDLAVGHIRKQGVGRSSIFLISSSEEMRKAIKLLGQDNRYSVVGCCDINSINNSDAEAIVKKMYYLGVSAVFVCSWSSIKDRIPLYWGLRSMGITLYVLPNDLETISRRYEFTVIRGQPFIKFSSPIITGSDFRAKQCFDVVGSVLLLLAFAPLFLGIALLIKIDSPGPIFYRQSRVGLRGKQFNLWKFRTMISNADKLQKELEAFNEMKDGIMFKMKLDPRITKIGKILRRYSLDELPQLFNVICGEMSLVGPRPLPLRDVDNFAEAHFIRHEVLPGITGLWQVSGRSNITNFEQVIRLDMFYIENWSLHLDLQILMQTIMVLVKKKGAF